MAVTIDEGLVTDLGTKLVNGQQEVQGVLQTLNGTAVADIHVALAGTDTAAAFDEVVTQLVKGLTDALPAFEALSSFINRYVADFKTSDAANASALRG